MGESMFLLNEKVVYPGYGVAIINRLVERLVLNKKTNFFELKFYSKDMTVLIPEDRLESIGVRKLSSVRELTQMFDNLNSFGVKDIVTEHNASTWNKRNKEYQAKLRSGKLSAISAIYKELQLIALDKELSFGERNLFNQIESLLIEEICAVKQNEAMQDVRTKLRQPFEVMSKQLINSGVPMKNSMQTHLSL
ncbi:MAG: CarD family transcriptional regulator [Candidatus Chromulinivorax sp.]